MALACCYICKHTSLRHSPKHEICLLFLFSYGSYAFAEAISLSGREGRREGGRERRQVVSICLSLHIITFAPFF